ncbi:fimbrial protein [Pseudomonas azotoformans]|uniref:Fimbrial protein n=1 Tax=Pseudomonas azotoformans TaxID=47878 RepID=A0A1V2JHR6_PSEAZ|nr:fimbrial protein [Pseudomonas azotoformans]OIN46427.1 fimbrial protein [Pseudomonas azotoformans]ONH44883.1 fimbrial protein [Pseudomonas azotoformans]SDN11027.1 Pilin (type 1 fimbria component protein) [Pseudomonas azotoformans]
MSIPFRLILASSIVGLFATSAMAADGTINFTGEITAASCSATSGAGTSVTGAKGKQVIDVKMGKVSMDSLGGAPAGIVAGTAININLDCGGTGTGLTTVKVQFDPNSGSGVDLKNNNLLKTTGTATGVGIGMYSAGNTLINLSGNGSFDAPLIKTGTDPDFKYAANLNLRAAYVANGDVMKAGTANGELPFTLTYE